MILIGAGLSGSVAEEPAVVAKKMAIEASVTRGRVMVWFLEKSRHSNDQDGPSRRSAMTTLFCCAAGDAALVQKAAQECSVAEAGVGGFHSGKPGVCIALVTLVARPELVSQI